MSNQNDPKPNDPAVRCIDLVRHQDRTESESVACSCQDTSGIPSSAYGNDGRLTFSGMLLTMEDCSFESWFAGRTLQMRKWGKQVLAQWREHGYPRLGEPPPNDCELSLLDFALGMMVGATMPNEQRSGAKKGNDDNAK